MHSNNFYFITIFMDKAQKSDSSYFLHYPQFWKVVPLVVGYGPNIQCLYSFVLFHTDFLKVGQFWPVESFWIGLCSDQSTHSWYYGKKGDPVNFFCIFSHERVLWSLQNHFKTILQIKIERIIKRRMHTGIVLHIIWFYDIQLARQRHSCIAK